MEKETGMIDWAIAGQRIIESQEPCTFVLPYPNAPQCGYPIGKMCDTM
jgi:hypothetical protein